MGVPATLLRKLYVENSLNNTPNGFQFQLKNRLAPATITRIGSLMASGREIPAENITLTVGQRHYSAVDVSNRRPIRFDVNDIVTVSVEAFPLPEGRHLITCDIYVEEVGWLHVPIEDEVREQALVNA